MNARVDRIRSKKEKRIASIYYSAIIISLFLFVFFSNSINETSSKYNDQSKNIANQFKAADTFEE
jgi:hypothetical protein